MLKTFAKITDILTRDDAQAACALAERLQAYGFNYVEQAKLVTDSGGDPRHWEELLYEGESPEEEEAD